MFEENRGRHMGLRLFHQVPVVGEEDDLGFPGEFEEGLQGRPGPLVVELNEDVVHDEGQGGVVP